MIYVYPKIRLGEGKNKFKVHNVLRLDLFNVQPSSLSTMYVDTVTFAFSYFSTGASFTLPYLIGSDVGCTHS